MIASLRAASFLVNAAVFLGVPWLLGCAWPLATVIAIALFLLTWWACGVVPRSETAPPEACEAANRAAKAVAAPPPRYVSSLEGWTAAAVRDGTGYGLLLGRDVGPEHREAVLAHEIAHYRNGDLFWEPFTDGPARLLVGAARAVPFLWVIALPFLVTGAPLARATELRADRLAADSVADYAGVLRAVASRMGSHSTILYPPLGARIRHSARDSKKPE